MWAEENCTVSTMGKLLVNRGMAQRLKGHGRKVVEACDLTPGTGGSGKVLGYVLISNLWDNRSPETWPRPHSSVSHSLKSQSRGIRLCLGVSFFSLQLFTKIIEVVGGEFLSV